jgi:hypothetical protein
MKNWYFIIRRGTVVSFRAGSARPGIQEAEVAACAEYFWIPAFARMNIVADTS